MAFGPGPQEIREMADDLQTTRDRLHKYAAELKEAFPKLSLSLTEIARSIHDPLGDLSEIAASLEYQDKRQQLGVGQA